MYSLFQNYRLSGQDSDYFRRTNLLNTFRQLIPNIDEYLNNIGLQDWVNILREIFDEGLLELDKIIEEKTVNNNPPA